MSTKRKHNAGNSSGSGNNSNNRGKSTSNNRRIYASGRNEKVVNIKTGSSDEDELTFVALGSGREVGRSCHVLKFRGKTIMLDCGIHPGRKPSDGLPFLDLIDADSVDLLLVTHFHLDHVASLPYFMQKTPFKGQVYMTHPTLAVAKMLLPDYVRVSGSEGGVGAGFESLYDEKDVYRCLDRCHKIDFHQTIEVDGVKFTAYAAGHVLGAAMFLIEIGEVRILYTGDYSRETDRHLMAAECDPNWNVDLLVVESTFGIQTFEPQVAREKRFTETIERIVSRGGKCLIPVFSLGRAQELLLILDEYWTQHPELQNVPIYHASKLATNSLKIYETFIGAMNDKIRKQYDVRNPWDLQNISNLTNTDTFDEPGPAVVMASPGMLQSGVSRKLFEQWCTDSRNGVIIAGYCVEGTLARQIIDRPHEIVSMSGRMLPLRCEVQYISFTAHSDFKGTYSFLQTLLPKHNVLVHGERGEMGRLKAELRKKFSDRESKGEMDFFDPGNCETLRFIFKGEKTVRAMGRLADECKRLESFNAFASSANRFQDAHLDLQNSDQLENRLTTTTTNAQGGTLQQHDFSRIIQGLLVSHNFEDRLLHPEELSVFTQLSTTVIAQRLHVPFHSNFDRLKQFVGKLFDYEIEETRQKSGGSSSSSSSSRGHGDRASETEKNKMVVQGGEVALSHWYPPGQVLIEWKATPTNDMVVDAIVALLMQAEGGISMVRMSACDHDHHSGLSPTKLENDEEGNVTAEGKGGNDDGMKKHKTAADSSKADDENEERLCWTLTRRLLEEKYGKENVKPLPRAKSSNSNSNSNSSTTSTSTSMSTSDNSKKNEDQGVLDLLRVEMEGSAPAEIDVENLSITCLDPELTNSLSLLLERAASTVLPFNRVV